MMVKRFLSVLSLSLVMLSAHAQYQFPNSKFDDDFITSYGSYTEPEGWHGYATLDASSLNSAGRTGDKLVQSTDVRSGATGKCVYVKSSSILGVIANGVMTNGQIYSHSTTATDGTQNYNFSDPSNTGSTSTYGANNKFFTPFTGRPDYMKVWLKNCGSGNARVSCYTHKTGTVMYDPTDNVTDKSIIVASAIQVAPSNSTWTQYTIPFTYTSTSDPGYILATFTTNETPGKGADGDKLYIDDIEMVYLSTLVNPTYNGSTITFDANGDASVEAAYNQKLLKYTTGAGATVETSFSSDYKLTITVTGNNVSVDPTNVHTYTIQFAGVASTDDDEADVVVTPTAPTGQALTDGRYYIQHSTIGSYLSNNNALTTEAQTYWTISESAGTVIDRDGHYFNLDRSKYSNSSSTVNYAAEYLPVTSNGTSLVSALSFSNSGEITRMYRKDMKYYQGITSLSAKYADIYLGASSASSLIACSSTDDQGAWKLILPTDYIAYYFSTKAATASLTNSSSFDLAVFDNNTSTTVSGLPLGIYALDNGTKKYVASGSDYTFSSSNSTLTYYGRLNLSLNATYDGTALSNGTSIDDVYDASKLTINLTGNGQELYETFFDEDTYQLTIYIKGYGRTKEYTIQFAAPDLSLNATWYGESVKDGQTIDEAYDADHLTVTPGKGATANVSYDDETGKATITISSSTDSETYTLNFAVVPATSSTADYKPTTICTNGGTASTSYSTYFSIATLENDNISFTINGISGLGSVTATNLTVDKNGKFSYTGKLRATTTSALVPVTIYGELIDGKLKASADVRTSTTSLLHATYGITTSATADYTDDLVVTINGDATTVADQTVTVGAQGSDRISFTLTNFQMPVNGSTSYIGNIFLENMPIDADGNFSFDGGLLIGPGADATKTWGGLDLGIVPINMRGQVYDYNGENQLIAVIDIDMQESLGQTIHVTFGADAVSSKNYIDDLGVAINGEETTVANTTVVIGTLKNDNISLTLTNFQMPVNGETSYIGNIAVDNIEMDDNGNFTYSGTIRIGKGTDDTKTWGGPDLGDVPIIMRGSIYAATGTAANAESGDSHCALVLDVDMQESLGQTIHVTYGIDPVSTKQYTDVLAVTVNGEVTTQETTVSVGQLGNGNINFTLDNFALEANGVTTPIGNISIENLVVDEDGLFDFDGTIRIGKGSDTSVSSWGGPELGDVPVVLNGQMYTKDGTDYLLVNIDIDMEAALGQTINVTFGATPESSNNYTDDLAVTVNGETTTMDATVTVGTLKNGYINFTLNNFQMQLNGATSYIGNIAINALEVDEDGKFTYNGNVRIGKGSDTSVDEDEWGGPDLGAIPMEMKGQFYTYNEQEYLIVSIDINMEESIGQTIGVLFGGTPISTTTYTDNLAVTVNDQTYNQANTVVTVGTLRNGNINFTLKNFKLNMNGGVSNIGNIALNNLELDANGCFSYTGNVRIGNGDDETVTSWGGPDLGAVPLVLNGQQKNGKLYVSIDIDMQESLSQIIHVEFGNEIIGIGNLVNLIEQAKKGNATKSDVETYVQKILVTE